MHTRHPVQPLDPLHTSPLHQELEGNKGLPAPRPSFLGRLHTLAAHRACAQQTSRPGNPPHSPQSACALQILETVRAPRGASARASPGARARTPAACSRRRRRRAPLSRPGPFARRLSRSLGPTHLLRRRPDPAADPDAAAGVAAAATRAGRATAGTRSPGRAVEAAEGAAAAEEEAAAAPRRGRPRRGPSLSRRAG